MPFIGGAIAGLGSIVGAGIGANAAGNAASTQARSAEQAINLQEDIWNQIQGNISPFLSTGTSANYFLRSLLNPQGGSSPLLDNPRTALGATPSPAGAPSLTGLPNLSIPDPSNPATIAQFQQSPGYNYELSQQQQAIQNSAAGRTGALSGNMLQALQANAQGLASQDYNNWLSNATGFGVNTYNAGRQNVLDQYNAANTNFWNTYNANSNNYWNAFNADSQFQNNLYSRLLGLSNAGQSAATGSGALGVQSGATIGGNLVGQGNAIAAGQVGVANALAGGISGATNAFASPNFAANNSGYNPLAFLFGGGAGYNNPGGAMTLNNLPDFGAGGFSTGTNPYNA